MPAAAIRLQRHYSHEREEAKIRVIISKSYSKHERHLPSSSVLTPESYREEAVKRTPDGICIFQESDHWLETAAERY